MLLYDTIAPLHQPNVRKKDTKKENSKKDRDGFLEVPFEEKKEKMLFRN